jgi:hypothetical protein
MITVKSFMDAPVEYNDPSTHVIITLPNGGQFQFEIAGNEVEVTMLRSLSHEMLIRPSSGNVVRLRAVRDFAED